MLEIRLTFFRIFLNFYFFLFFNFQQTTCITQHLSFNLSMFTEEDSISINEDKKKEFFKEFYDNQCFQNLQFRYLRLEIFLTFCEDFGVFVAQFVIKFFLLKKRVLNYKLTEIILYNFYIHLNYRLLCCISVLWIKYFAYGLYYGNNLLIIIIHRFPYINYLCCFVWK